MEQDKSRKTLVSTGIDLIILTCVEGSVALVLLLARLYTTWKITRHVRPDLYLSIITFIVALLGSVFLALGLDAGLGVHDRSAISSEKLHVALKWNWVNQTLGIIACGLGKLAIVAFLHQMHGPDRRTRVVFLWSVAGSNIIVNFITIGTIYTQCSPREKLWNGDIQGTCDGQLRNAAMAYFQGSWSALCDLILALYPTQFLWHVRLEKRVKIGLCILMGLGLLACTCAVVKTTTLHVLSDTKTPPIYGMVRLVILNETEKWIVFIVGCVPPIRPLLMIFFHRVIRSAKKISTKKTRNGGGQPTELQSFSNYKHATQDVHIHSRFVSDFDGRRSNEEILGAEEGIMKTTEVSLSYEGSSVLQDVFEMQDAEGSQMEVPYEKV